MTEADENKFLQNSMSRISANIKSQLVLNIKDVSENTVNELCYFCKSNGYKYKLNKRKGRFYVFNS